jgi:hypothetical protein
MVVKGPAEFVISLVPSEGSGKRYGPTASLREESTSESYDTDPITLLDIPDNIARTNATCSVAFF